VADEDDGGGVEAGRPGDVRLALEVSVDVTEVFTGHGRRSVAVTLRRDGARKKSGVSGERPDIG
jgi:hypothetical protein